MKNQDQDLLVHIAILPLHVDTKHLTPSGYQIKEELLRKPMVDITKVLITTNMKEVLKHMDRNVLELMMLLKQNDIMRGSLHGIVGPIDPDHLEIILTMTLERKENETI